MEISDEGIKPPSTSNISVLSYFDIINNVKFY